MNEERKQVFTLHIYVKILIVVFFFSYHSLIPQKRKEMHEGHY